MTEKHNFIRVRGAREHNLKGVDLDKNQVSYTGKVWIGGSQPLALAGKSMKGVAVTGSTGAQVTFSPSGP